VNYSEARDQIQTGDVLTFRGHTALALVTRVAQKLAGLGPNAGVTHCGVAVWVGGRLYSTEMDGRHNVLRPVSQHVANGNAFDVYRPIPSEAMVAQFDKATAEPIKYNFIELVQIGGRLVCTAILRIAGKRCLDSSAVSDRELVCSTFVSRWLQWAGWVSPAWLPKSPSPGELGAALGEPILRVGSK
jgi:hypothetical protein